MEDRYIEEKVNSYIVVSIHKIAILQQLFTQCRKGHKYIQLELVK